MDTFPPGLKGLQNGAQSICVVPNPHSVEPIDPSSTRPSHGGGRAADYFPYVSLLCMFHVLKGLIEGCTDGMMITMIFSTVLSICTPTGPVFLGGSTSVPSG